MTSMEKMRRKLLKLFDRKDLETMSRRPAPWHADRATLETEILAAWPHDEIEELIGRYLAVAR